MLTKMVDISAGFFYPAVLVFLAPSQSPSFVPLAVSLELWLSVFRLNFNWTTIYWDMTDFVSVTKLSVRIEWTGNGHCESIFSSHCREVRYHSIFLELMRNNPHQSRELTDIHAPLHAEASGNSTPAGETWVGFLDPTSWRLCIGFAPYPSRASTPWKFCCHPGEILPR